MELRKCCNHPFLIQVTNNRYLYSIYTVVLFWGCWGTDCIRVQTTQSTVGRWQITGKGHCYSIYKNGMNLWCYCNLWWTYGVISQNRLSYIVIRFIRTQLKIHLHPLPFQQRSLVLASGKMVLMDKLLPKLKQDGHKVRLYNCRNN